MPCTSILAVDLEAGHPAIGHRVVNSLHSLQYSGDTGTRIWAGWRAPAKVVYLPPFLGGARGLASVAWRRYLGMCHTLGNNHVESTGIVP